MTDEDLGGTVIECAALSGVQHLVYSTGVAVAELTNGAISIPGLDCELRPFFHLTEQILKLSTVKVKVERKAYSLGRFQTVTPIVAAWFMENWQEPDYADLFGGFPRFPDAEGYLTYTTPFWGGKEDFPWISMTDDFGDLVHGILLRPERWNRRLVQGTSDIVSSADLVNHFVSGTCVCFLRTDGP